MRRMQSLGNILRIFRIKRLDWCNKAPTTRCRLRLSRAWNSFCFPACLQRSMLRHSGLRCYIHYAVQNTVSTVCTYSGSDPPAVADAISFHRSHHSASLSRPHCYIVTRGPAAPRRLGFIFHVGCRTERGEPIIYVRAPLGQLFKWNICRDY